MDILLYILAGICIIVGIIGCIAPGLPGPPISFAGLLLLHFTSKAAFSGEFLMIALAIVVIIQILDYYIPVWCTKKFGGSKKGVWGSIIGLVVGIFSPIPFGFIIGPFLGAVIGELIDGKETLKALKSGFGAFVGFLLSTAAKLTVCFVFGWYYVGVFI